MSVGFAVFVGVGVFEDAEVGGVTRLGYQSFFEGFDYGAVWLVGMGAVVETAIGSDFEYLGKEVRCFIFVHFDSAESSYSRGVYQITAVVARELEHFGKGSGMSTGIMHLRYGGSAQVEPGYQVVDEGGFAYAGVA